MTKSRDKNNAYPTDNAASPRSRAMMIARGEFLRSIVALIVLTVVAAVLLAGLAIPIVGVAGVATKAGTQAFKDLPDEFEPLSPSEQSVIVASDGSVIAKFYAENRIVVDIKDMSEWVQKAAVAIEDRRFYEHKGVDPYGLFRAAINNLASDSTQGASTITQQYVKNTRIELGLQTGDDEAVREASAHTLTRKILEAKYAVSLEHKMPKKKILEGYLNIAPFGPNVYGVEAASRHYFSKSAKDLELSEAVLLAGLSQSPVDFNPLVHPKRAQTRRDQVLFAMLDEKLITKQQYDEVKKTRIEDVLHVSQEEQGCQTAGSAAYFCQYVVAEILNSVNFGKTIAERRRLLTRGGLIIQSTLNPTKQKLAQEAVEAYVPKNDPSDVRGTVTSVEPGTGKIIAMAQNTNFGQPSEADPTATQNNLAADKAHGGGAGYQPGSSFKTMTLATWYQSGRSGGEVLGGRTSYAANEFRSSCPDKVHVSSYNFKNSEGLSTAASSVIVGTERSLNTTYVAMASKLDLCDIKKMAEKVGAVPGDGSEPEWYPSSVLGSGSVPPLSMANAFATFANKGVYCSPIAITSVTTRQGKELEAPSADCHRTVDETVANKVMQTLKSTYNSYGGRVSLGREAGTKTGTTDGASDAWLVGATPNLSTAVWMGHSDRLAPMVNITIGGQYYRVVYGSTAPSAIWKKYMIEAVADLPKERFPSANIGSRFPPKPKEPKKKEKSDNSSSEDD
ncbi:MAG: transglycosylase domain-containing protein [Actinomycetaceae bacterium]|nr:transglycosylase domain-containing protein [Actinomycetaceae bacterium]